MRIAVFGASGWLGQQVVAQLAGRHTMLAIGRPGSRSQLHVDPYDPCAVQRLLEAQDVSAVVNAQGTAGGDVQSLVGANITTTTALVQATADFGCRLVHLGSAAEVGGALADGRHVPINAYGWSKALASRAVLQAADGGADMAVARVHSVVAPGMTRGTVVEVHRRVMLARSVLDLRDLDSTRDYVSLTFVGRAVGGLVEAGARGVVDVCSGSGTSPAALAEAFTGLLGRELDILCSPNAMPVVGDPARLRALGLVEHMAPVQLAHFVVPDT